MRIAVNVALLLATVVTFASAQTGGFANVTGGAQPGAKTFTASNNTEIQRLLNAAFYNANGKKVTGGAYPLTIIYTGNEDALIERNIRDSTVNASGVCPAPHWNDPVRNILIKNFYRGVTILGANGSSANWGIVITSSSNVIVRNMKIGAVGGAASDGDCLRIDGSSQVWIDHNELLGVNHECPGSPDGDLTFDGYMDIKGDAHNITVSYNYIHDAKKVGLDGSSDTDLAGGRQITFHHNIYSNVHARIPLQRGGWTHMYNNLYTGITDSGINVRMGGYSLVERNWFENAHNPVVCRFATSNCGFWDLRSNNIASAADFATYGITWPGSNTADAQAWISTAAFPIAIPYAYSPVSPQCVKDWLPSVAGVGKGFTTLSAALCDASPKPPATTRPSTAALTQSVARSSSPSSSRSLSSLFSSASSSRGAASSSSSQPRVSVLGSQSATASRSTSSSKLPTLTASASRLRSPMITSASTTATSPPSLNSSDDSAPIATYPPSNETLTLAPSTNATTVDAQSTQSLLQMNTTTKAAAGVAAISVLMSVAAVLMYRNRSRRLKQKNETVMRQLNDHEPQFGFWTQNDVPVDSNEHPQMQSRQ